MSEETRAHHAAHAQTLATREQEMYLTLLGMDVWRMYRQGMNRGMLLEMYATDDEYNVFLDALIDTLNLLLRPKAYGSLDELATFVDYEVEEFAPGNRLAFDRHGYIASYDIANTLGAPLTDRRVMSINRIATTVFDAIHADMDREVFIAAVAPIWFAMCDKALLALPPRR